MKHAHRWIARGAAALAIALLSGCATEQAEEVASNEAAIGGCPDGQVPSFWYTVDAPAVTAQDVVFNVASCASCAAFVQNPAGAGVIMKIVNVGGCGSCAYYSEQQLRAAGIAFARSRTDACIPDPVPRCAADCRTLGYGGGAGNWAGHCTCSWDADVVFPARATCSDNTPLGQCSPSGGRTCVKPGGSTNAASPYFEWGAACSAAPVASPGGAPCTQYDATYAQLRCGEGRDRDRLYDCRSGAMVQDCARSFGLGCTRIGEIQGQQYDDGCVAGVAPHGP